MGTSDLIAMQSEAQVTMCGFSIGVWSGAVLWDWALYLWDLMIPLVR